MTTTTRGKHLLSIADLSVDEVDGLIRRAAELKGGSAPQVMAGKSAALLFEKPSLRTKVSFDVAVHQLGGHPIYMGRDEVGMGVREPVSDTARILSRYVSVIIVRTFAQSTLETLAEYSSVPVINALSDDEHPCQALADLLTVYEKKGGLRGVTIAYIGDGNNVAVSLALGAASVGANFTIASPAGYAMPDAAVQETLRRAGATGAEVTLLEDPREAVRGADVVYTDVWTSMGQEAETERRRVAFAGYRVDPELMALAGDEAIFMHPLPAHPGEEIAEGMQEHPRSVVFDQAENRLHAQKAALLEIMA